MTRAPKTFTDRDRVLLESLAEQRVAVVPLVAHWLGVQPDAAVRRLRRLRGAGLLEYEANFQSGSSGVRITGAGLRRIGSSLSAPGRKRDEHEHDVGVAWIWTAMRDGALGPMAEIMSERGMRSHDGRLEKMSAGERRLSEERMVAVDLGLPAGHAGSGRHYPDLMMRTAAGNTIAVELELSSKGRKRLDRVMNAYASDALIDAVLYLVPDARLGRTVTEAAQRAGISEKVHVRQLAPGGIPGVNRGRAPREIGPRTLGRERGRSARGREMELGL